MREEGGQNERNDKMLGVDMGGIRLLFAVILRWSLVT